VKLDSTALPLSLIQCFFIVTAPAAAPSSFGQVCSAHTTLRFKAFVADLTHTQLVILTHAHTRLDKCVVRTQPSVLRRS
jgi:hypothetical protein